MMIREWKQTKAERLMILFESAGPSGLTLNDLVELFDGTKRNGIYPLIHKLIQRGRAEEAGKVTNAARVACPTCGKYPNANPLVIAWRLTEAGRIAIALIQTNLPPSRGDVREVRLIEKR